MNCGMESCVVPEEAANSEVSEGALPPRGRFLLQTFAFLGPPVGLLSVQDHRVTDGDFPGTLGEGNREHLMMRGAQRQ